LLRTLEAAKPGMTGRRAPLTNEPGGAQGIGGGGEGDAPERVGGGRDSKGRDLG
jgi:hypothetical protein